MNVSIQLVRVFLEVVAERGVSREQFLARSGIEPERLEDLDGRLEISELDRLQEAALDLTGDPALGIHMAERASAPAYDVIGHLATHAPTLRDCITSLLRFGRIFSDATSALEERGDEATLVFKFTRPPDSRAVRLRAEQTLTGFVRLLRAYAGEGAMPREALFEHRAPPYRAEYARFFGGTERFEQAVTALRFDRAMLSQEAVHKSPRLSVLLMDEAERRLERLERGVTHAERVRDLLATACVGEGSTMDAVARRLGMSVRSLRRRLAEEGASYPRLLEEAQAAFAKRRLQDPERSIYETAVDMGFSDASAFHRAFRRWTGMTPTEYRERSR
jgi:AraC-like DNA-binding protein